MKSKYKNWFMWIRWGIIFTGIAIVIIVLMQKHSEAIPK